MSLKSVNNLITCCALLVTVNANVLPTHIKGIQIKNKGHERLLIVMTGEDNFILPPGQLASIILEDTWSGTIFARPAECQHKKCNMPYTVAELQFGSEEKEDRYRVSIMDGFNMPVKIQPTSPNHFCKSAMCTSNLNENCPHTHQIRNDDGHTVACRSVPDLFQKLCPTAVITEHDASANTFSCRTSNTYIVSIG